MCVVHTVYDSLGFPLQTPHASRQISFTPSLFLYYLVSYNCIGRGNENTTAGTADIPYLSGKKIQQRKNLDK